MATVTLIAPNGISGSVSAADGTSYAINGADGSVSVPSANAPSLLAAGFIPDERGVTRPPYSLDDLVRYWASELIPVFF